MSQLGQWRRLVTMMGAGLLLIYMANTTASVYTFERTPAPKPGDLGHPICWSDPLRYWADGTPVEVPCP